MSSEPNLEGLRRLLVVVAGAWKPGSTRDWHGVATAGAPLVGVAFVTSRGRSAWCKSGPAKPDGQPVHLLLGHHDQAGVDVQVNWSVGGGQAISRCVVESRAYQPTIMPSAPIVAGQAVELATISGTPPVVLSALFLAAADVKVGRNRLWHLRPELAFMVQEPYRAILTRGRSGESAA